MNDLKPTNTDSYDIPVSFKVIGIGSIAAGVIEKVEALGYDCVGCFATESPEDCIPNDEDKMVIIVAVDNYSVANDIARNYHDAGVLTLGLLHDADTSCFDSVMTDALTEDFPEIIKTLLQPIVTEGYICYDFNDLCTTLRNTRFFKTLIAESNDMESSIAKMQRAMDSEEIDVSKIEYLSAHIYINRQRQQTIAKKDISYLSDMLSKLPESINIIWSVNFDDTMSIKQIRSTLIMAGKKL